MKHPTDAVVLAAGEGRRLRPLTAFRPKPLLPVANRPIVDYVMEALRAVGVGRVVVVVGHGHSRLQTYLVETYPDVELEFVSQEQQLGSGHALQQAMSAVDREFLVVNGDTVLSPEMVRATEKRRRESGAPAIAVRFADRPEQYGVVETTDDRVDHIDERPTETDRYLVNAGVYALDLSVFDALEAVSMHAGELHLPHAVARLDPVTVHTDEQWFDPATPWELLDATEAVLSSESRATGDRIAGSALIHDTADLGENIAVGPGCEVGAGAVVRGGSCLRSNVTIGPNAVVHRTVVDEDARIDAGAVLYDSIVGSGAHLGPNTVASGGPADVVIDDQLYTGREVGSVVGDRARIGANVTLSPGVRIGPNANITNGATVAGDVAGGSEVLQ